MKLNLLHYHGMVTHNLSDLKRNQSYGNSSKTISYRWCEL